MPAEDGGETVPVRCAASAKEHVPSVPAVAERYAEPAEDRGEMVGVDIELAVVVEFGLQPLLGVPWCELAILYERLTRQSFEQPDGVRRVRGLSLGVAAQAVQCH